MTKQDQLSVINYIAKGTDLEMSPLCCPVIIFRNVADWSYRNLIPEPIPLPSGISQVFWLHNILSSSMQLKCFLFSSAHFFWKWIEAEKIGTCLLCVHEIWLSANRFNVGKAMIHSLQRIFRLPTGQALCWRSSTFSQSGNLGNEEEGIVQPWVSSPVHWCWRCNDE